MMQNKPLPDFHFEMDSSDQVDQVAGEILKLAEKNTIFAFYGEMGAGKTTLIRSICRLLGTTTPVSSPTFSIVNEYQTSVQDQIYHFDFYRINSQQEVFDLGYENYFFSGHLCFIEWPERIEPLLDFKHVKIRINLKDKKRIVFLHA